MRPSERQSFCIRNVSLQNKFIVAEEGMLLQDAFKKYKTLHCCGQWPNYIDKYVCSLFFCSDFCACIYDLAESCMASFVE